MKSESPRRPSSGSKQAPSDDDTIDPDHSSLIAEAVANQDMQISPEMERLHEIIADLDELDRIIYHFVVKEELSVRQAGKVLGIREGTVRYHMKKIHKIIATDPDLIKIIQKH